MSYPSWLCFSPRHREDLSKSGLTLKTVNEAGIKPMAPREIDKRIKFKGSNGILSVLRFPYMGEYLADGREFERYKLFWDEGQEIKGFRYYQPKGSGSRLYVTQAFVAQVSECGTGWITEGEKKALALSQRGFGACGLGGVWNFKGRVLERLKELGVRELRYIPDGDVWDRGDLMKSVGRFNHVLQDIGCKLVVMNKLEQ